MNATLVEPTIALVGNPNAGKTSLFNALTGARQKVGNYPGVTVERKTGRLSLADGRSIAIVDLPGAYSLSPQSPDEQVTRNVLLGQQEGQQAPDALVCVVDATNLRNHLRLVLELAALGRPTVVALNMVDLAQRDGIEIDIGRLSSELGIPVVPTVAVRRRGLDDLVARLPALVAEAQASAPTVIPPGDFRAVRNRAREIARAVILKEGNGRVWSRRMDKVALHPVVGPLILATILFVTFQAVFAWAEAPMGWIEATIAWLQGVAEVRLPDGLLRSFINDGVLSGVGSVIVFLPQILILFFFIILLEQSGYMTRAAFLMDRLMSKVGLSGGAFIPLLSSFACAIPGIMATRTIDSPKDRMTTLLIAPLMTCSARLPVYAVIIAAFIPDRSVGGFMNLQGLVLFGLYVAGIVTALMAAFVLRKTVTRGASQIFMMEMPVYQWPPVRDVLLGLYSRALIFLKRAGTIIFAVTVALWLLLSFPNPPADADEPAINYTVAGRIAGALHPVFEPIGFGRDIVLALIPGMAAREVAVSSLGTIYSLQGNEAELEMSLVERLRSAWPLPTALAFLAWFVFAPQCLSTLAVARRETNSWRWPVFMFAYLFALAYVGAGLTYWIASALL